jgi:hypothetical protein
MYLVAVGGLMSHSPRKIRKSDIESALKAATSVGMEVDSYAADFANGLIFVFGKFGRETADRPDGAVATSLELDRELAEFEARNGQG